MKTLQRSSISLLPLLLSLACGSPNKPSDTTTHATHDQTGTPQAAEQAPEAKLPIDPDIRVGTLANGLTYYIKQHQKPEARASLRLAVNAGAVQEDEDQRGLAHFLEHMAFNGTKRFEKMAIVNYLESIGMQFGPDVNAYTSFDETVYMLQVPTDKEETLAKGLDILHEWSHAISLDPKEVEKERGVVIEEWRLGRGAGERIFDKQFPIMFQGSKYAQRLPIGKKSILETAPVSALQRFYDDWYRPDLMAVVAVGDFDPDKMEKMIKERFSTLTPPKRALREREQVVVPNHKETLISIETDPEETNTSVQIIHKMPHRPEVTKTDYRRYLAESIFHSMLNARFDKIGQRPASPYMFAYASSGGWARSTDQFSLEAYAKEGRVNEVVEVLLTEIERVTQHGFTAPELERAKAGSLRSYKRSLLEHEKTDSSQFASEIIRNFLEKEMMPGIAHELRIVEEALPQITLEELNVMARQSTSKANRVVLVSGPAKAKMPTKSDVLAKVDSVAGKPLVAYKDPVVDGPLMPSKPAPGSITKTESIDAVGVTVWTLSNGARVVWKATDFQNDSISLTGFSPGGHSTLSDKDYATGRFASSIVGAGGVGKHSDVAIGTLLAGKVASASTSINELEETVYGGASPADLETMLQLLHLRFVAPRKHTDDFAAWKANQLEWVRNRNLNPERVFFDEVSSVAASNHLRRRPVTTEMIESVSQDRAHEIYKERFSDAGDFTFIFVGNIDEKIFKPLIETYVASLPATGRNEKWKDVGLKPPRGIKKIRTKRGTEPKSFVYLTMHGKQKWSWEADDDLDMLSEVMSIRLREVLREDMGGVYGVFSGGWIERRPKERFVFQVGFGCAPANAKKLKAAVSAVIAEVKKEGASDEIVTKIKEKRRRSFETDSKENYWWRFGLSTHFRHGTDPAKLLENDKSVQRVSAKRVKAAARKFLKGKSMIDAVLHPVDGTPQQ